MRVETIGRATLYCGDSAEVMASWPADFRVDAVVTDPPYGIGFPYEGYEDTLGNLETIISAIVPQCLARAARVIITPGVSNVQRYPVADWIGAWTWETTATFGKLGFSQWQPILYYGRDLDGFGSVNGALKSDRIHFAGGSAKIDSGAGEIHTCPKPLGFMKRLLTRFTNEGETVLDPFLGSGTTGAAAVACNRDFIGIEREPAYFDIACRRIEHAQRQGDLFIESAA
jgi:DNA modification methylase